MNVFLLIILLKLEDQFHKFNYICVFFSHKNQEGPEKGKEPLTVVLKIVKSVRKF